MWRAKDHEGGSEGRLGMMTTVLHQDSRGGVLSSLPLWFSFFALPHPQLKAKPAQVLPDCEGS